jgi:glycosyltransferase involved in cell wall biosynthesis
MITVCIPTLPDRIDMLERALRSVERQTLKPKEIIVEPDHGNVWDTRNDALDKVTTELVAWLDDDDTLYPWHLETLFECQQAYDADLVHADYDVVGVPSYRASFIEVTHLSKTELLRSVGGFPQPFSDTWPYKYEDWGMLAKLLNIGSQLRYVPKITWTKYIHGSNIVGTGL